MIASTVDEIEGGLLAEQYEDPGGDVRLPAGWRVLMIANGFTSFPEASGGVKHFLRLAGRWLEDGQDLSIMTTPIGKDNCMSEGHEGPFLKLPGKLAGRLPIALMYLVRAAEALFFLPWRGNPRLVYGTSDMICDVLPSFLYRLVKGRSSFWVNCVFHLIPKPGNRAGSNLTNYLSHLGQKVALWMTMRLADVVVVDNELLRDQLSSMGFAAERLLVVRMGTDLPDGGPEESPLYDACFLGRLHESKGIFDLVRVWSHVCARRPGSTLAIVGTGPRPLVERLNREIAQMDLRDYIKLLGYVSRDELDAVLSSSRVFVFPSHEEGFGISILEAMAHNLPVVTFELPHYRGIFEDVPVYIPEGDTVAFSEAVVELFEDDVLRSDKQEQSRVLASQYSWYETSGQEAEAIATRLRRSLAPD